MGKWLLDIHRGEPGYSSKLDRDGDGIACERANAPRESLNHASRIRNPMSQLADGSNRTVIGIILLKMGMQLGNAWQGSYYLKSDGKMATSE